MASQLVQQFQKIMRQKYGLVCVERPIQDSDGRVRDALEGPAIISKFQLYRESDVMARVRDDDAFIRAFAQGFLHAFGVES